MLYRYFLTVFFFVLVFGVTIPGLCWADAYSPKSLKTKADTAMALLQQKMSLGCDVAAIVPKMKSVKTLANKGKLKEAHNILDDAYLSLKIMDCQPLGQDEVDLHFTNDRPVLVDGYDGDIMEPFVSRNNKYLFFNDARRDAKDLYWAMRIDDYHFKYMGEIKGVNTSAVDAVPTMDVQYNFYFTSTHKYGAFNKTSVYVGRFDNGAVRDIRPISQISLNKRAWLNMDSEISADGQTLYSTHTYFGDGSPPTKSYFFYAKKQNGVFVPQADSDIIFKEINKDDVVYALAITKDELEIVYTRLRHGRVFETLRAVRNDKTKPFKTPKVISAINGYAEAPTYNKDDNIIYYHKKVASNDRFRLFALHRKVIDNSGE